MEFTLELEKENVVTQKLRGGYYTPSEIVDFISRWAINKDTGNVLEPSCGDGNFVESAIKRFQELGVKPDQLVGRIKGIELVQEEAQKAKLRAKRFGLNSTTIVNSDFFQYAQSNTDQKYDAVLGNPPFIRYQNFPEEHRRLAIEMMQNLGLNPNKLTNIWVPFLVISASLLTDSGKLGMVIPAELFQVKYAAETRIFLSQFFKRITIVTFKKLVFSHIQQEIVILLCDKITNDNTGIRVIECDDLRDLDKIDFESVNKLQVKSIDHSNEKWTKYFLDKSEIELLRKLKSDPRVSTCSSMMEVDVGIVTGRNEFFMMNKEQVSHWKLEPFTLPVISKSNQLKGIALLSKDLKDNVAVGKDVFLFSPPNVNFEELPKACKDYIRFGEKMEYNTGYKCQIRKRWYATPSLWVPDGYALRQVSDYPKIIVNNTKAASTDTIHRVRFKKGFDKKAISVSFLNSLTFAFSEITGRSYGGGVLTFEPTEIEELPVPKHIEANIDVSKIDEFIRKREINKALDVVDRELLIKGSGFLADEVGALRNIWKKLSARRLTRSRGA